MKRIRKRVRRKKPVQQQKTTRSKPPVVVTLSTPSLVETFIGMGGDCLKKARTELKTFESHPRAAVIYNISDGKYWWGDWDTDEPIPVVKEQAVRSRKRRSS